MSKTLKTIIIALLLFAAVLIYLLFFRKSDNNILYKIPKTCTSVVVIDMQTISSKLILDGVVSDSSILKRIEKFIPDSLKGIDWTSSGLGLAGKVAFFIIEDTLTHKANYHFITTISNISKFNKFMDTLCSRTCTKVNRKQGVRWLINTKRKLLVAWDKEFVTGMITAKTVDVSFKTMTGILSGVNEQSIMTDSCFVQKLSNTYDILVYSKQFHYSSIKYLNSVNSDIKCFVSYIHFNKGRLDIDAKVDILKGSDINKLLSINNREIPVLQTDSAIVNITTNIDPKAFRQILSKSKIIDIKANSFSSMDAWDGRLNLIYNGTKAVKSEFVSYEYDDDFNKVEVKKSVNENIMDIQAAFGLSDSPTLLKEGSDTLLFKGGNFLVKKQSGFYNTYNRFFSASAINKASNPYKLALTINHKRMGTLLNETKWDFNTYLSRLPLEKSGITVSAKGNIKATVYFTDTKENVLLSILAGM